MVIPVFKSFPDEEPCNEKVKNAISRYLLRILLNVRGCGMGEKYWKNAIDLIFSRRSCNYRFSDLDPHVPEAKILTIVKSNIGMVIPL